MPKKIAKEILSDDLLSSPININDITKPTDLSNNTIAYFKIKSLKNISNIFNAINSMVANVFITFYNNRVVIENEYTAINGYMQTILYACNFESYFIQDFYENSEEYYSDDELTDEEYDDGYLTISIKSDDIWKIFKQNKHINDVLIFEVNDEYKLLIVIAHWNGIVSKYTLPALVKKLSTTGYGDVVFTKGLAFSAGTFTSLLNNISKFGDIIQIMMIDGECTITSDPSSNFSVMNSLANCSDNYFQVILDNNPDNNLYIVEKISLFMGAKKCTASTKVVLIYFSTDDTRMMKMTYRISNLGDVDIYAKCSN